MKICKKKPVFSKKTGEKPSGNKNRSRENNKEKVVDTEENEDSMDGFDEIHNLLKIASDKYQDDDGYVNVSSAGTFIKRAKPDFDSRTYGFLKLPQLLEAFPDKYEIKRYPGKGTVTIIGYKCL